MTNNDELALKLKAAALNATPGKWSYARSGFNSIVQAPVNMARGGASRVMVCALKRAGWRGELATAIDAAFIAEANPENILALLAERDADKKRIEMLEGANASQDDHINQQQDRIDALEQRNSELGKYAGKLESISTAAEKLVRCKGRYHSEQNYRALAALFGVTTPDLPPPP